MREDFDTLSAPPDSIIPWSSPVPTFTYLAGAAGVGKTFITKLWAEEDPGVLLLSTTGIAAVNLGGTTINAALGYFDTKSLQDKFVSGQLGAQLGRLYRSGVRRLIVDEISMMCSDQLTYLVRAIEEVNGRGYVLDRATEEMPADLGLTIVGDMAQLAPIKAAYAFESPEWHHFAANTHTLTEIRRQADTEFIEALRAARVGDGLKALKYFGPRLVDTTDDHFDGPTILAKNEAVDRFNQLRFDKISGPVGYFQSARWGKQRSEWGNPEKPKGTWGIPDRLAMKVGALVMILNNVWMEDKLGRRGGRKTPLYVNGDLGEIIEMDEDQRKCVVRLQRTGLEVPVVYAHREVLVPCDSARRTELRNQGLEDRISDDGKWEITGSIDYMPLRLAYACTVHKSQGLSLDRVQVNMRDPFFKTVAMLYVALSRARTPDGLRLVGSAAAFVERCVADPRLKAFL